MGEGGRQTTKTQRERWPWFLALFGLLFLGVGISTGPGLITLVAAWQAAQDWVETPATIDKVELKHHHGDDSTTYEVRCTYRYSFDGREFVADRVGLTTGGDNIGSWQKDTHNRLRRHKDRNERVSCYVDPSDPRQALLDRDLRWAMIWFKLGSAGCFCLFGLAILAGAIYAIRRAGRISRLQRDYPDEPWRWKPAWQGGVIRSKTGWRILAGWVFAILWNAVTIPVLFSLVPEALREGEYIVLLFCLFPFVGAGMLIWAVRMTFRHRRFGRSYLELGQTPGVVGGHLRGDLTIVGELTGVDRVEVILKCINRVTTSRGGESRTQDQTIWSEMDVLEDVAVRFGQRETRLPVDFQIPYACRPCDESDSQSKIFWELQTKASLPGADLDLAFDVPVFKTAQSDPSVGRSQKLVEAERRIMESEESPEPNRISLTFDDQGNRCVVCSCWPGLMMPSIILIVSLAFGGVAVYTFTHELENAWFLKPILIIFGAIFGLLSLAMFVGFLSFFGSFQVSVNREGVTVVRRYIRFRRTKTVSREMVDRLMHKETGSSGETKYYGVYLVSPAGVKTKIAGMLKGETIAEWLKRRIERELGIEPAETKTDISGSGIEVG